MLMIGEYDFIDTFTIQDIKKNQVYSNQDNFFWEVFPVIVQFVFILSLFFVSIIIGNLITGLTVNNIRELYKEAGVYKLGKTVKQIKSSEEFVNGKLMTFVTKLSPTFWETSLFKKLSQMTPNNLSDKTVLVCVEPNAVRSQDDSIMKLIQSESYEVFSYDGKQKRVKLGMQLPSWIIRITFEKLKEKQKLEKELNVSLRKNIKEVQRDFDSMYGDTGTISKSRRFSEMKLKQSRLSPTSPTRHNIHMDGFGETDQSGWQTEDDDHFPMIDFPGNDEIDWELHAMSVFVDKIASKNLTQEQRARVRDKLNEFDNRIRGSKFSVKQFSQTHI